MNTAVKSSRRAVLSGIAAALAAAPALGSQTSRLDELIADYRWAEEAATAAEDNFNVLFEATELPKPQVRCGKRRIRDSVSGDVTWGTWEFGFTFEIERHFEPWLSLASAPNSPIGNIQEIEAERDALIEDLMRQQALLAEAERASGITAAEDAVNRAILHKEELREEIFAFRPSSMAEVAVKNAWLLEQLRSGNSLEDDLVTIFGGSTSA